MNKIKGLFQFILPQKILDIVNVIRKELRQYNSHSTEVLEANGSPVEDIDKVSGDVKCYYTFDNITMAGRKRTGYSIEGNENVCLPLAIVDKEGYAYVDIISEHSKKTIALSSFHWNYLNIDPNHIKKVESLSGELIFGDPISLSQNGDKECVIFILVDALGRDFLDECGFDESMPNTAQFFQGCRTFNNTWSQGEWTLPCVASIVTGLYTPNHGVWRREITKNKRFSDVFTIQELYKKAGYVTSSFSSISRFSYLYGFNGGTTHFFYREYAPHSEITYQALEHLRAFPYRSHFLYLHYMDIHHILRGVSSCASQLNTSIGDLDASKSFNLSKMSKLEQILGNDKKVRYRKKQVLKELDFHIAPLFNYISKTFSRENLTAILLSDHGKVIGDNHDILSKDRCNSTLKVYSPKLKGGIDNSFVNAVDILPSVIDLSRIDDPSREERDGIKWSILGGKQRNIVRCEAIDPRGKYYELCLRNDQFVFYYKSTMTENQIDTGSGKENLYLAKDYNGRRYNDISEDHKESFSVFKQIKDDIINKINL